MAASLLLPAFFTPTLAGTSLPINTDKTLGLENGLVRIEFDKRNGSLKSLKNLVTGDEYLKKPEGGGNPFRAYLDTTQLPKTVTIGYPWPVQPVEEAMGGKWVDPANCVLSESSFMSESHARILRLVYRHEDPKLEFVLEVRLPEDEVAADLNLEVRNAGELSHHLMTAIPYLTGLSLGPDPNTNQGILLRGFGTSRAPAWTNQGGIYGRDWSGQWNVVYEKSLNEGFGLIVPDQQLENKIIRRFPGGGMSVLYFDNQEIKAGEAIRYPTARILIYKGTWKLTARRYRAWFATAFKLRPIPDWVDDYDTQIGRWFPTGDEVAKAKQNQPIAPASQSPEDPYSPGGITSFRQLDQLYLPTQIDLTEWVQYWQSWVDKPGARCMGIYDYRKDMGGQEALREGVARVERVGRLVGLYVAGASMRVDSPFFTRCFPNTQPQDWLYMDTPATKIEGKDPDGVCAFFVCYRYKPWQDHLARTCKELIRQTGAKYIRLDEVSQTFLACYNPVHKHAGPYRNATPEMLEFLRTIREAIDEVDPDVMLVTENPTDLMNLYTNAGLSLWSPGPDIAPLRLSVPTLLGISGVNGHIDNSITDYIDNRPVLCNWGGWAIPYHESIMGAGLERRPASYEILNLDENGVIPGIQSRWHELRHSFAEAMRLCDPTDFNPETVKQKSVGFTWKDNDEWAGQLWKSPRYWLMVCGNRAGIRPLSPVTVRLPELPDAIKHAYEFDFESLAMRETKIERKTDGIYVDTNNGFSAVFFPMPDCPPLVLMEDLPDLAKGRPLKVELKTFAPWLRNQKPAKVKVVVPGLTVMPVELALPGTVQISVPANTWPGYYYIRVKGDCLPLRRWFSVNREG